MNPLPRVLHRTATPISVTEFVDAIQATCRPRFPGARGSSPQTIALAISGGVDSMALAYLCKEMRRREPSVKIADNPLAGLLALIVNHNMRDGSTEEARAVSDALTNMGLVYKSVVLPLFWRESLEGTPFTHPKELPNFETVARRLRYQALGRFCARFTKIKTIFLAHHEDDQYETLLMRLMRGSGNGGLLGMRPAADIPECHDIHGAHQSGFVDDQLSDNPIYNFRPRRSEFKYIKARLREDMDPVLAAKEMADGALEGGYLEDDFDAYVLAKRPVWGLPAVPLDVEDGGIMLYRPLLEFGKDRLIATCEANNIPWFEDATNSDPTLTRRNAVRYLCKHHTLPVALQKPAIMAMSNRLRCKAEADEAQVDRLLNRTILRDFDSTSGTLFVRLPSFFIPRRHRMNAEGLQRRLDHYRHIAALLLKRLIAVVTPELTSTPTSELQTTVLRLFPCLNDDPSAYPEQPKAFNIASVHFLPVRTSKKGHDSVSWHLSREPFVSCRPRPLAQYGMLPLSKRWRRRPEQWPWPKWKPFQLWDGRYWVKLINRTSSQVGIMPFDIKDANTFRKSLPRGKQRDQLAALLKLHAPGKVRYTLPAIYTLGDFENVIENYERMANQEKAEILEEAEAQKEWDRMTAQHGQNAQVLGYSWEQKMGLKPHKTQVDEDSWEQKYDDNPDRVLVALPTLGISKPGLHNWIKYQVRYKKVDRSLLKDCARDDADLARYERARRRAKKKNQPGRLRKRAVQKLYTRRPIVGREAPATTCCRQRSRLQRSG